MKLRKIVVCMMMVFTLALSMPIANVGVQINAATAYLNYTKYSMTVGYTLKLKVNGTSGSVAWGTSNKNVATVKNGSVTGKGAGTCIITAKVNGQTLKCNVTVIGQNIHKESSFTDTTLDVLELKLDVCKIKYTKKGKSKLTNKPGTFKLSVLNKPKNKTVKWSTSNKKVATVKDGKVTAVKKGKCTITAKIGKKKYKTTVVVTNLKKAKKIEKQENIYAMLKLMNKDRVKAKAAPLKIKASVNKVADLRVSEMTKEFSHTRPNGTSYKTAYDDVGVKKGTLIGENLAYTSDKVDYMSNFIKTTYESLYDSPTHKANMLNPEYKQVGISYYNAGTYYDYYGALCVETYWVQEFYTK